MGHFTLRCLVLVCVLGGSAAAQSPPTTLFRLFLADGSSVVSYGEYARVNEDVIFSMPLGRSPATARLQAVTLPTHMIDWARTERYAAAARAEQYAVTRGEDDFVRLTNEVAGVLNEIALSTDRSRALALAERARTALVEWPETHFGYRQRDVREIVMLLDESISGLRASLGIRHFDVALVADAAPPALEPLLGLPRVDEQIRQLFRLASLVERPSEKIALLQAALLLLPDAEATVPSRDLAALRRGAEAAILEEQMVDARYDDLSRRLMSAAQRAAARARVVDVERILTQISKEDRKLGERRRGTIAGLRAAVQSQLEAARHLRLIRDRWTIRRALYRDYQRTVGGSLLQLVKAQPALEAIRRLEGPPPARVLELRASFSGGAERLARLQTPDDLQSTHALLTSAWQFAENALKGRYDAIQSGNLDMAREASSSAAGALLMLTRVQQDMRALLELPRLQ